MSITMFLMWFFARNYAMKVLRKWFFRKYPLTCKYIYCTILCDVDGWLKWSSKQHLKFLVLVAVWCWLVFLFSQWFVIQLFLLYYIWWCSVFTFKEISRYYQNLRMKTEYKSELFYLLVYVICLENNNLSLKVFRIFWVRGRYGATIHS